MPIKSTETFLHNFDSASDISIVAEISANHQGNIKSAFRLIDIAKISGADAVKFQTYTADTLSLDSLEKISCFQKIVLGLNIKTTMGCTQNLLHHGNGTKNYSITPKIME